MAANSGAAQDNISQHIAELQSLWQSAGQSQGITPAGAQPGASGPPDIGQQIINLQTLWNSPRGGESHPLNPAGAGPGQPPAASDDATTALINKLKQGQGGGNG
jgi:hypothetical protein